MSRAPSQLGAGPRPLLFGADFADYPIMQETLLGLAGDHEVLVGGRSGLGMIAGQPAGSSAIYFDWQPYQRAGDISNADGDHRVVDSGLEPFYDEARRQFARALDRVFLSPLTGREAEDYFWALVAGLEAWCQPRRDRLIVMAAHTPHFPWHIVFFHVCRRLKIPFFIFKRTQTPDGMFLDTDLVCGRRAPLPARAPVDGKALIAELGAVSGRLARSREINRAAEAEAFRPMGLALRGRLLRRFWKQRHYNLRQHYYREPWWRLFVFAMQRNRERRADLAWLAAHAQRDAPAGPYVYFALHYQPERTTVPEAGFHHDQIRAVTALARALPAGWKIAVKEHPRQLGDRRPDLRCLHYSRRVLYEAVAALDNAVLMDAFTPSAALIDNARLTASCNGSSVFEGLQLGVPGLTFVRTWHSGCESAPAVADVDDLAELVQRLAVRSRAQVRNDFHTFVRSECRFWFVGANDDRAAALSTRSRAALIEAMRVEIAAFVESVQLNRRQTSVE